MISFKENGMVFNILLKKEVDLFLAHCLELDIVATGNTMEQAQKDLIALVCAQVDYAFSNNNLENLYHPAPKELWKEFFDCKERVEKCYKLDATFSKSSHDRPFVPPYIIAKTCQNPEFCHA